jgi:hypothetical protein
MVRFLKPEEGDHMKDLGAEGRIKSNWILKRQDVML